MKDQPEQQQAENNEVGVISYVEKVDYDLLEGILMKNKCKQYRELLELCNKEWGVKLGFQFKMR